jgi:hypothetical protein
MSESREEDADRLARALLDQMGTTDARIVGELPDGRFLLTVRTISVPVSRAFADKLREQT